MASKEQKPGMLLNIVQCTGQLHNSELSPPRRVSGAEVKKSCFTRCYL